MVAKNTDQIKELSDYEHIRLRTPMYLGSTDLTTETMLHPTATGLVLQPTVFIPALMTMMGEVVDNAVDEIVGHKGGNRIDITYDSVSSTITVADNGRGVPIEKAQLVFSSPRAGRNFNDRENVIGANGIGASAVNFVSKTFYVDVWKDKKHYHQKFSEDPKGKSLKFGTPVIVPVDRKKGTKVEYTPSDVIFPNKCLPEVLVEGRVRELAFAYPEVTWSYNGVKLSAKDFFPTKPITIEIADEKEGFITTFYLIPNFHAEKEDHVHAIVNSRLAWKGGEHVKAFKSVFFNGLAEKLSTRKLKPTKADVAAGLLIFAVTRMTAPVFDSQSKSFLANAEAGRIVRKQFDDALFSTIIRKNKPWIDEIYKRCAERVGARSDDDARKQTRKKEPVAKLTPANGKDRSKCILILGEGDSALTKAVENRSPDIHGILPLKGKMMNAVSNKPSEVFATKALLDIINALGLQYGKKAVRSELAYGKVYIATDEDPDGDHIMVLLIAFFFTYWPELFDANSDPFIFKLNTPFILLSKNNDRKYIYSEDADKFDPAKYKGWKIRRAKGLGALESPEWQDILQNGKPNLTPVVNDDSLKEMLHLLLDKDRADDRKEWLSRV